MFETPGQGPLGHVLAWGNLSLFDLLNLPELFVVECGIVLRPNIAWDEGGTGLVSPAEKSFGQRHACQDSELMLFAKRQNVPLRLSKEAVVKYLQDLGMHIFRGVELLQFIFLDQTCAQ